MCLSGRTQFNVEVRTSSRSGWGRGLVGMVRGWGIHDIYESPHKDWSTFLKALDSDLDPQLLPSRYIISVTLTTSPSPHLW